MKKIIFSLLSAIVLLMQPPAFAAEKLTLLLDWFLNPGHAPLFVAQQHGFFKEQNLDVVLIGPSDPSDPPKLVAAGKADMAITYEPKLLEQIDQGLPLAQVGTLVGQPLDCLVVLKNSSIQHISDLKGKRVGYSTSGMSSTMLKTMLEHNGLHLNDVEAINVHYDLTQALLAKKVDAVTGMMRTFEVIQMDLNGHPARIFLPEKNGMPSYSELVFVVNKNNQHDPRITQFLAALKKGVAYLEQHPEETWQEFAKAHPELNDELNHRAWIASLPYFAKDPAAVNMRKQQAFKQFMLKNGLIQEKHNG